MAKELPQYRPRPFALEMLHADPSLRHVVLRASFFELRDDAVFDLPRLLAGGDGLLRRSRWLALAPHLEAEVEVAPAEREWLAGLSPARWQSIDQTHPAPPWLDRLVEQGLAITDRPEHARHRSNDECAQRQRWWPLAALWHRSARFLKKPVPSAGSLHPTETYLLVQRVEGMASGSYHYRPVDHALQPLPPPAQPLADLARLALAGQHWFADAPVLLILAPRFLRSFWKYRNHAKAYRAMILDVGHISQTLYLSATELGLGAFVTSAINEVDIEQALGLDGLQDGPLAICGFGWRAEQMQNTELDPNAAVWSAPPAGL